MLCAGWRRLIEQGGVSTARSYRRLSRSPGRDPPPPAVARRIPARGFTPDYARGVCPAASSCWWDGRRRPRRITIFSGFSVIGHGSSLMLSRVIGIGIDFEPRRAAGALRSAASESSSAPTGIGASISCVQPEPPSSSPRHRRNQHNAGRAFLVTGESRQSWACA